MKPLRRVRTEKLLHAAFFLLASGCGNRCQKANASAEIPFEDLPDDDLAGADGGDAPKAPGELPARCTQEGAPYTLPPNAAVGTAVRTATGFAVGLTSAAEGGGTAPKALGTRATVAQILTFRGRDFSATKPISLGPTFADAPAPLVVLGTRDEASDALLVGWFGTAGAGPGSMHLARYQGGALKDRPLPFDREATTDESPDLDVALGAQGALAVWDAPANTIPARGVIAKGTDAPTNPTVVFVQRVPEGDAPFAVPLMVAREGTDAESPQIARDGDGWLVGWIASKPAEEADEPPKLKATTKGLGHHEGREFLEGAGEGRTVTWLEIQRLDAAGNLQGTPMTATSKTGHVTAFSPDPRGAGFYVGSYGEDARDTGKIRLVTLVDGKVTATEVRSEQVAHGVFDVIPGRAGEGDVLWFLDSDDGVHLLPRPRGGVVPVPLASHESVLDEARPLLRLDGDHLLAAKPRELLIVRCSGL